MALTLSRSRRVASLAVRPQALQVVGQRRFEAHLRAVFRVRERKAGRMQRLARDQGRARRAAGCIDFIADNRVANVRQMNPNLMLSA